MKKKIHILYFIVILSLILGAYILEVEPKAVAFQAEPEPPRVVEFIIEYSTEESRIQLIKKYFPNDWEMAIRIFDCESGLMQKKNGVVVEGPTSDFGIAQLHLPTHGEELKRLGLDPMNIEDNLEFAKRLHKKYGWTPWVCKDLI